MLLRHCALLLLAAGLVLGGRGGFRSGGGSRSWGSRSSSSGRGGWFSRSRSSSAGSKPASSSYPKQQWGSSGSAGGLSRTGSSSSLGSTGSRNIGGGEAIKIETKEVKIL